MLACIVWGLWVWMEHFGKAPIPPCELGDWEAQCCLCCCKMQDEHVGRCFLACWLSMVWMQRQPEPSKIITWGTVLCAWNCITSRTISPPSRAQSLGWFWDVLGFGGNGKGSGGRRVILHGAVLDPAGFRSSSCSRPSQAPHIANAGGKERMHPLPGTRVPGTRSTMNSDGGTSYLRRCVTSPGGITFIWS